MDTATAARLAVAERALEDAWPAYYKAAEGSPEQRAARDTYHQAEAAVRRIHRASQ